MYVSKVKIIANKQNRIAKELSKDLEELGYFIVDNNPDVLIYFYPLGITIRKIAKNLKNKEKDPVVISITDDGGYVIPLIKEHWGGSFLGGIIADLLGSQLVLTSRTAQLGLYSIEEFAWVNGLEIINRNKLLEMEKKLIECKKLNVFSNSVKLCKLEGYEIVEDCKDADIVVGSDCKALEKLIMRPYSVAMALGYTSSAPKESIYYSIKSTLKSIYISETRLDFILVPEIKKEDQKIREIAKSLGSTIIYVPIEELRNKIQSTPSQVARKYFNIEGVCEPSLEFLGSKIILKRTKRAYGVVTCLGIK